MKISEFKKLIKEEVSKMLKEGKLVQLRSNLIAYPKSYSSATPSKKIEIPRGESIEIIEHPFEKQPNDSLIKYKDQEYVVVRSSLDKVLGTIKEGLDSKPIKSFKVTELSKIFAKIGFPTSKVEVYDNVNAGPTLSIEFKNTLADENAFIDAYTDFQFDNGALGSMLPDIESAYHKGGNKWEFQMQK